ncbi:MAG: YmdB family metallophosphoesterase [Hyphomicrobiales bacterium]|nr:YmdB family metallophosphoesterase [Rickettsiales bacterium]MCP5361242.1 YmdB family metallophosphoesterase [Hyphomicrobiales bacterium]
MRLLFCGDVVGRSGRQAITTHIPTLRRQLRLDFVVVNGENAAGGFGITEKICDQFQQAGADVITGGDHTFDQPETAGFIARSSALLRPANFPENTPGLGHKEYTAQNGQTVVVVHLLTQLFMKTMLDSPFEAVDRILKRYALGGTCQAIIVDLHGEATSEKMAMGHYLDGRVSMVVGSHTHVPTADAQILPGGTAYQTDAGMCGDYHSVIGYQKDIPVQNFLTRRRSERLTPAGGEATLCGVYVETDDRTGLAKRIVPVRTGGRLQPSLPE